MEYLSSFFGSAYTTIVPFIILLGILIFVHELGHFLVARLCGVRVEVFSLGFGKKILSYKWHDTVYCISLIPLGGYVKMFGEMGSQKIETEEDKKVSYSHKNPWQRIAIVLAGPLMNFFFAFLVFGYIAQTGEQTKAPVVGEIAIGSAAEKFGFRAGDRILNVNGANVRSYEDFQDLLNQNKNANVRVVVKGADTAVRNIEAEVGTTENPNIFSLQDTLGRIDGLEPYAKSATVGVLPDSLAEKIGLRTGDLITEVNSQPVRQWSDLAALIAAAQGADLKIKVTRESAATVESTATKKSEDLSLELTASAAQMAKVKDPANFGVESTELYLDQIVKDSPAAKAELQRFDRLISINNSPITKWEDVSNTIRSFDGKEALDILIRRDGTEILKKITPQVTELTTAFGGLEKRYTIGIMPYLIFAEPEMTVVKAGSVFESMAKGMERTIDISVMTVMSFVKLFQGQVSVKNVGGMLSIGKAAKDSYQMGEQAFLVTMGILSVSLFILNLLPIPVLDGGHLVFYIIELVKGSPLSLKKMEIAQQVGLVLLLGLMILAQYNDIMKFLVNS